MVHPLPMSVDQGPKKNIYMRARAGATYPSRTHGSAPSGGRETRSAVLI